MCNRSLIQNQYPPPNVETRPYSESICTSCQDLNQGPSACKLSVQTTHALPGLAPKCKLINMHELINKSTNDYVKLLPCENGANVNNKGYICKKCRYYVHILMRMRETC